MSSSIEGALRYLFQVGYNVAHSDFIQNRPYNGDAGKEYAIFETREIEARILRSLVAQPTHQPDDCRAAFETNYTRLCIEGGYDPQHELRRYDAGHYQDGFIEWRWKGFEEAWNLRPNKRES